MASSCDPKRARLSGLDAIVTSLDLASLGSVVCCMTVVPDGTRFVFTRSALFAITKGGMQSLVAGHKTERGFKDGQDSEARFNCPHGITVDGDGNLLVSDIFVADDKSHCVRRVAPSVGAVTKLVGVGAEKGFADEQPDKCEKFNAEFLTFVGFQDSPNLSKIEKVAETCEFDGKEPLFVERTIAISNRVLG